MSSSTALEMFTYVIVRMNCPVKNGKKIFKSQDPFQLLLTYLICLSSQHLQTMQLPNNPAEYKNQTHTQQQVPVPPQLPTSP